MNAEKLEKIVVQCLEAACAFKKPVANVKIVSGGQTGVDRGALEAADALGLDFGGWAPHGWIAEDGTIPVQFQAKMQAHPSMGGKAKDYRERSQAAVSAAGMAGVRREKARFIWLLPQLTILTKISLRKFRNWALR